MDFLKSISLPLYRFALVTLESSTLPPASVPVGSTSAATALMILAMHDLSSTDVECQWKKPNVPSEKVKAVEDLFFSTGGQTSDSCSRMTISGCSVNSRASLILGFPGCSLLSLKPCRNLCSTSPLIVS